MKKSSFLGFDYFEKMKLYHSDSLNSNLSQDFFANDLHTIMNWFDKMNSDNSENRFIPIRKRSFVSNYNVLAPREMLVLSGLLSLSATKDL